MVTHHPRFLESPTPSLKFPSGPLGEAGGSQSHSVRTELWASHPRAAKPVGAKETQERKVPTLPWGGLVPCHLRPINVFNGDQTCHFFMYSRSWDPQGQERMPFWPSAPVTPKNLDTRFLSVWLASPSLLSQLMVGDNVQPHLQGPTRLGSSRLRPEPRAGFLADLGLPVSYPNPGQPAPEALELAGTPDEDTWSGWVLPQFPLLSFDAPR